MVRCLLSVAAFLALAGCADRQVEHSDFVGRWTWEGTDCSSAFLEVTPDAIYLKAADGEHGRLFNVRPGPHQMKEPTEYVMHLEMLPHRTMDLESQRALLNGQGRHALLLKLEHDKVTPLSFAANGTVEALAPDNMAYKLFNVSKCS